MTAEEARYFLAEYKPIIGFVKYRKALNAAINALEKQVPMKPHGVCCGSCGYAVIQNLDVYCPRCGQKIQW